MNWSEFLVQDQDKGEDNVHRDCADGLGIYFGVITEKKGMKKCIMTCTF